MLSLPGMDWPAVPETPGSTLSWFFSPQALLQKAFLTPRLLFFPWLPSLSSLAELQLYLCQKKQTEHIAVEALERILPKVNSGHS